MKPCPKYREPIALLVLDELDDSQFSELETHLQTCESCRHYRDQLAAVAATLGSSDRQPDIATSATFHRRVVQGIESHATAGNGLGEWLLTHWRSTFATASAAAALVLASGLLWPKVPTHPVGQAAAKPPTPAVVSDVAPTLGNYERAARASLDRFDQLLTRQANRNLPPAPIYTASAFTLPDLLD